MSGTVSIECDPDFRSAFLDSIILLSTENWRSFSELILNAASGIYGKSTSKVHGKKIPGTICDVPVCNDFDVRCSKTQGEVSSNVTILILFPIGRRWVDRVINGLGGLPREVLSVVSSSECSIRLIV